MKAFFSILTLAVLLISASCSTTPSLTATEYNDAIVDEHAKIITAIQAYYDDETYELSEAEKLCTAISNQCDTAIRKVGLLPAFDGGEDFKNTALKMFQFYKKVSKNEFMEMSRILANEDYDDEDMDLVMDMESKLDEKIAAMDLELEVAQKKFAKDKNFTIQY